MKVALLGQPNVGKSSVLTRLTGARVFVSNYPGTSVELVSGTLVVAGHRFEVLDTPGIYSLGLAEAEETVSRKTALAPDVGLILNVVDASNLGRNLALTLELLELGKPVVVLLNQIDRARALGIDINHRELSRLLGCPVFPFSAVTGEGVVELTEYLHGGLTRGFHPPRPAAEVVPLFTGPGGGEGCRGDCRRCLREEELVHCPQEEVWARHERAHAIAMRVTRLQGEVRQGWLARLEAVVDNPWAGTPLLLGLLYAAFRGLVAFVGWAEEIVAGIFGPVQEGLAQGIGRLLPPGFWRDVLSSGVPEGLLVPFALVLPAMLMVAVLMALLEDSGLLPRYAVALERLAGLFGVSGQAFIPLALGFGCRTPAVVATRMLPTPQQRFIVIALLSIVIPCAATVGMITAVVAALQASLGVVAASMLVVFILLGLVLSRLFGDRTELLYELPPLRVPTLGNVAAKVRMRFGGFFTEVLPLLVVMSVAVRIVIVSGWLEAVHGLGPLTHRLFGIPAEAFVAVLVTMVQRYLAPLVLLNVPMSPREATIAIAMITLSLPCLPVMVMTAREAGWRVLAGVLAMAAGVSMSVGIVLNLVLPGG